MAAVKANLAEREERASELEKLKRNMFGQKAAGAIAAEYASDSAKLEKLLENKDYIDLKRGQLAAYDEACELVARMRRLDAEKQALEALKEKTASVKRRNRLAGRRICFDNGAACVQAGAGGFPYRQKVPYGNRH